MEVLKNWSKRAMRYGQQTLLKFDEAKLEVGMMVNQVIVDYHQSHRKLLFHINIKISGFISRQDIRTMLFAIST